MASPSGTVTFLFTDIEGSTPLWDSFPGAMGPALARHDEIVRSAIDANGGRVFSTGGDGFGAVFGRAADAIAAALAAQRHLFAEVWVGGPVLRVRMGVHTGEAEERDGDFFGPPVNRAARIMGAANGGQVLVSDLTAGLVDRVADVKLVDLGLVELKGVIEPVRVFGVAGSGHEWLDTPLQTGRIGRGNLPRLQTEWVGDLAGLQRRVSDLSRAGVVTLTGSGGVGKTRAAIEIGWLVVDEFVDGVWLVELAPVADPDLAVTAIASTLGVTLQPGMSLIESIVDWCLGRRMLLILDNCEHVLDPVIELVQAVVASSSTVTVIATSREPLGVAGETLVRIPSLDEHDAVELFVLRAQSADAGFEPTDADVDAIAGICRRLDGIPLAIELAAARIRALSPAELLERLDDRFRLLRGRGRGGLERHQTLRATVAWSYQLLSAETQLLFDRSSVFAGGFDLDAAEAICAGGGLVVDDIIDLLGDLVDKSTVNAVRTGRGTRYRLLETLRQYGEERLDERTETATLRDAHLRHYVGVAQRLEQQWWSPDQAVAIGRFDDDWDNIGAAHSWAITTGDIDHAHDLTAATSHYAQWHAPTLRDQYEWGARTLQLAETTRRQDPRTLVSKARWAFIDGDPERAVELGELAVAINGSSFEGLAITVLGHMAAGRTGAATQIAAEVRSTLPTLTDPIDRHWAAFAAATTLDPNTMMADTEIALSAVHVIGAPIQIAERIGASAMRWFMTDPPNPDLGFAESREAIRLHKSIGSSSVWERMNLAWCLTATRDPRALETFNETIRRCYNEQEWLVLEATLEAAPELLAPRDPAAAATIFGYLEDSPAPFAVYLRARAIEVINAIPDNETHRRRGAAMDRHEIVALTLTALADS